MLLLLLPWGFVLSQETSTDESLEGTEESSKKVDEEEEDYRQRMELREQQFNQKPQIKTTYTVHTGEGKLDQLPEASRENIKEQLRDMIIENPEWKPGQVLTDYPYELSAAAQSDPSLARQEREAWVEQLEKYQEREAAAYAKASALGGQPPAQQGEQAADGQGQPGQPQQGQQGQGQQGRGQQGQSPASAEDAYNSVASSEREAKEVSTEGVSESALSFLQGKGGKAQQPPPQGSAGQAGSPGGEPQSPQNAQASAAAAVASGQQGEAQSETDQLADAQAEAGSQAEADAGAEGEEDAKEEAGQEAEETTEAALAAQALAGTLEIDELQNAEAVMTQESVQASNATGNAANGQPQGETASTASVEPGTLTIEELQKLEKD